MPDVLQDVSIRAPLERVFEGVSTPSGLAAWWPRVCEGEPGAGAEYRLAFGPGYDWRARVSRYEPPSEFELELADADPEWLGSRVGFTLEERDGATRLAFRHTGWPEANEHYRISCNCWALYLRLLRRWAEHGETVPWEARLDA